MFDRQSLHVAMLLWGCIFCLIASFCMFMSKNFDKRKRRCLIFMQMSSAALLLCDAAAWAFRGTAGHTGWLMVHISNFFVFFLTDLILALFHGYLCNCLFGKDGIPEKARPALCAVYLIAAAGMCLVVVSQFTGLYYEIDANNLYHRNPGHPISFVIPLVGLFIDFGILFHYRKRISKRLFLALNSYMVLPLTGALVQIFYYGLSLINIAISISMILVFVVSTVEQNEALAVREQEASDLRVALMMSQIKPHFIYNTLATIEYLCDTDPEMAKETVIEFARYLRFNLNMSARDQVLLFEQELSHVKYYCAIEKKRFRERVNVVYDIEEMDFFLPSLTLQPIVENAIKHGICAKQEGGTVWISTRRTEKSVVITVKDNGAGFDPKEMKDDGESHIGIKNVAGRLEAMCGGTLTVRSEKGKGTEVIITLPD